MFQDGGDDVCVSIIIYLSKWSLWKIRNRMQYDNIKVHVCVVIDIFWTKQTYIRQKHNSETINKIKLRMTNIEYNFLTSC